MATAARSRRSVHGGTQSPSASDVSPFAPAPVEWQVCGFTLRPRLLFIAGGVLVLHTSVTVIEEELFSFPVRCCRATRALSPLLTDLSRRERPLRRASATACSFPASPTLS